jgi:hypothetical protein
MGHLEWLVRMTLGDPVRVKRWTDMVEGEPYQEATHRAMVGIMNALSHRDNEQVARSLYADLTHSRHHGDSHALDEHAWRTLAQAFDQAHFIVVPLHNDPSKYGWAAVSIDDRRVYVVRRLVEEHHYSVAGAAGIVGNLEAESDILPNRLEGSVDVRPLRAPPFGGGRGVRRVFTPEEIQNRNSRTQTGPLLPGVGLAQWTAGPRRRGLFARVVGGVELGPSVLTNMDAQVDYLASELRTWGHHLRAQLVAATSVDDACDLVAYYFETPQTMLDDDRHRRAMTDPRVQAVFVGRRSLARLALRAYEASRPSE